MRLEIREERDTKEKEDRKASLAGMKWSVNILKCLSGQDIHLSQLYWDLVNDSFAGTYGHTEFLGPGYGLLSS